MSIICSHKQAYCSSPRWYMNVQPQWNDNDSKTEELGEETVPVSLCTLQIQYGNQASMVRGCD
jgi:hypothetical protein